MDTDSNNATQSEFEALIEAFPPYSTNAEIIGRLADTVESLREVASESSIIHRAARIRPQATSTWQLDENAAPHDDGLIADYSRLCREMQSHVALQSNALAEIQVSETRTMHMHTSHSSVKGGAGRRSWSAARHAHGVWHHPHV